MNRGHYFFCVWSIAIVGAVPSFAIEATDGNADVTASGTKDSVDAAEPIVPKIALDLIARGEYEAALPYYRETVSNNLKCAEVHNRLAGILFLAKKTEEAISEWEEANRLAPRNAKYLIALGHIFAQQGDRERCLDHFNQTIQLSPDNPKPLIELAKIHIQTGGFPSAAEALTKALAIEASPETRMFRAVAYRRSGQFADAIEDCDYILNTTADDHRALACRAFSRMRSGDLEGASQDSERVIAAREVTAHVGYLVRGCVRFSRREFDVALGDLSMAIDLAPQEPLAYVMRAVVHFSQSRSNDAMSDLDDAIKLSSSPQRLNYELDGFGYQVYKFRGLLRTCFAREHKKAIEDLNQAIELNGKDSECFTLRGIAHSSESSASRALGDFERAVELQQDDDLANFLLVNVLICSPDEMLRDGKRAIELAKGLNDRHPHQPVVLRYLAGAYSEAGEFEEAENVQSQVLELLESAKLSSNFSTHIWWGITFSFGFSPSLDSNRELLKLYQQKKPFRLAEKRSAAQSTLVP